MNKISAIIIAKNEENIIRDSIESLSFCDEVIVINNNSVDNTKDVAQNLSAKVFDITSTDFSEIRNFGLEKASFEWILYVDADERVSPELKKEIKNALSQKEFEGFFLKRKNFYLGNNEWPHIEKMLRLFKKENLSGWSGVIHESPQFKGKTAVLDGFLNHYTHRNLEEMVNKTIEWSSIEASNRFKQNHPPMAVWRFPRVMISAFLNSFILQKGYKAKTVGIIESLYQAFSIFITYAKLWEMQNTQNVKRKTEND